MPPSGCFSRRSLTLLTFASNRALGPVVTSTLGNLAPLFAVTLAVLLLHEPLQSHQLVGAVIAVSGAVIITVTRPRDLGSWRSWALLLPLTSALVRGVVPPIVKLGLRGLAQSAMGLPDRLHHVVAGGADGAACCAREVLSSRDARSGRLWFAVTGISNGLSALSLFAAVRNGPITLVAPLAAIYPLVTVGLSAVMLKHIAITPRIVAGTALTVAGVALVLIG